MGSHQYIMASNDKQNAPLPVLHDDILLAVVVLE